MHTKRWLLLSAGLLGLMVYFLTLRIHRNSEIEAEWLLVRVVKGFFVDYYAVDVKTGKVMENIPPILTRQPQWSADTNWILLHGGQLLSNEEEITLLDLSTGKKIRVVEKGRSPRWSPDGKKIAYVVSNVDYSSLTYEEYKNLDRNIVTSIYVIDVSCIIHREPCQPQAEFITYGSDPTWSPDGQKIVYVNYESIYIIDLSNPGVSKQIMTDMKPCAEPAWSNHSDRIIMRCKGFYIFDGYSENRKKLEIPDRDTYWDTLFGGTNPTWNPTDEKVVFVRYYFKKGREVPYASLYIMDADGSNISRLTNRKGEYISWFLWIPKSAEPLLKSCWLFCK